MNETLSRNAINAAADRIRRIDLRAQLLPAGTRLRDVPVDYQGLTVREWEELQWIEMRVAAMAEPKQADLPLKISTSRDNYGLGIPSVRDKIG